MKSKREWMSILGPMEETSQQADAILADLAGYRKTSLKRAEDADSLNNALEALHQIEIDAHDRVED